MRLLRQWLKNINHQTEPALTHKEFNQRWGPFVENANAISLRACE